MHNTERDISLSLRHREATAIDIRKVCSVGILKEQVVNINPAIHIYFFSEFSVTLNRNIKGARML
jgi:hypothetical protein